MLDVGPSVSLATGFHLRTAQLVCEDLEYNSIDGGVAVAGKPRRELNRLGLSLPPFANEVAVEKARCVRANQSDHDEAIVQSRCLALGQPNPLLSGVGVNLAHEFLEWAGLLFGETMSMSKSSNCLGL